jgi:hypothetical protein
MRKGRNLIHESGGAPYYRQDGENDATQFRNEDAQVPGKVGIPPPPGSDSVGPALFELVQETRRSREVSAELLRSATESFHKRSVIEATSGETDANGNLDLRLFQVPQGHQFTVTRVTIEAAGFTPAAPYGNAAAWIALIRGAIFASGSILDFGPAASGGTILPSIFSSSDSHAPAINGGEILTLHLVGAVALANVGIWARCQGRLTVL